MTEQVVERELYFSDEFFPKFIERGTVVLECIKNKTEILESDWDIVEEIHRLWMDGKFGWKKSTQPEISQSVTQGGLFDDKSVSTTAMHDRASDNFDDERDKILDGKEIDVPCEEPKKKSK
jgi:hypothetical protein